MGGLIGETVRMGKIEGRKGQKVATQVDKKRTETKDGRNRYTWALFNFKKLLWCNYIDVVRVGRFIDF